MVKKVREYKSGDFIFAKVKGYPAWPARVQRQNGKKYYVYFYGTGETANLPPNQIFDYAENKDKFLNKTVKRKDFNDGVRQIEHDFANNVALEDVIGVPAEVPMDTSSANDTVNETANDSAMDTTAADTTTAETTAADDTITAQNDAPVEDSDDGALIIDEGKKGKKSISKLPSTPKAKEAKTPRGKGRKEDEEEKKQEEIVSRSGRKIRPKRYMDEQTEENATLPSPAPKKRRAASPEKETAKDKTKPEDVPAIDKNKVYNAITQSELEDIKEPYTSDTSEKDNVLIACLPNGQYVGIKLFQSKPTFKNDSARLSWEKQAAANAITLKQQLERGHITAVSVCAQLEMDLNLTDEEKANLDKEREIEEKKSRVQFLKTEMKLIELDAKIKSCLSLEKADTELCLKLLDELMELSVLPLMLLKHPSCLETVKRMRAYVGNTPVWELSQRDALLFSRQAHLIRKMADKAYHKLKDLFPTPSGLSFWEFFSERVVQFKRSTAALSSDERLEMVHEPRDMSEPTPHTMRAAIDAANDDSITEEPEKVSTPKSKKSAANSTPKQTPKRQSSRTKQTEQEAKPAEDKAEKTETSSKKNNVDSNNDKQDGDKTDKDSSSKEEDEKSKDKDVKTKDKDDKALDKNDKSQDKNEKSQEKSEKSQEKNDKTNKTEKNDKIQDKSNKTQEKSDKAKDKADKSDKAEKASEKSKKTQEKQDKQDSLDKAQDKKDKGDDKSQDEDENDKPSEDKDAKIDETEDKKDENSKDDSEQPKEEEKEKSSKEDDKTEEKQSDKEDVAEPRAKRARENSKKTEQPTPKSPGKRKSKS